MARSRQRYVEKLATPDVTVADIIGDLDPIKAARGGHILGDELTMHYGMLPRANRGIFALNELPDLAGKVQVSLFNIMQEGDVQIKGYPVRLPLDVMLCFTANPEDYTARGKIITPLKDRIGSEVTTHYPETVELGMAITESGSVDRARRRQGSRPRFHRRSDRARRVRGARMTSASTSARASRSACRSACSRTSSRTPSVARSRPASATSCRASPTSTRRFPPSPERSSSSTRASWSAATPSRSELIRRAADATYQDRAGGINTDEIIMWFDVGGALQVTDDVPVDAVVEGFGSVPGLMQVVNTAGLAPNGRSAGRRGRMRAGARVTRRAQEDRALRRGPCTAARIEEKRRRPYQD